MSSLYVAAALLATFLAVLVAGIAVEAVLADRRRTMQLLRSQVKEISTNLREREMAKPFAERVLVPLVAELGEAAKRITPVGMRNRIARQLVLAGNPQGMDANKVAAMKVFGAAGGAVVGLLLGGLVGNPAVGLGAAIFLGLFAYLLPGAGLGQRAIHRQDAIRRAMPDTIDLLSLSVEAGLGFDAAMAHVRRNVPGPLSDEMGRVLQEMQLGESRATALRHLAQRSDVEELKAFVLAMVQADIYGVSIANVLRAQSRDLRMRRRQRAEELAQKVPVKLLFPLIFGFLPALFVVLVVPGVIRIAHSFLFSGFRFHF